MDEQLLQTGAPGHDLTAAPRDNRQLYATPLKTPFQKIALALSGGGFRAASYSIGTMSYLHHLKYTDKEGKERSLLDNVEFISSASGGTYAGMLYAAYTKKGIPFEQVYKDILEFMTGEGLLDKVLSLMNEDEKWEKEENGDKTRNFINAFAKIYDEKLFKGETFGVFWGEGIGTPSGSNGDNASMKGGNDVSMKGGTYKPSRDIEVCFNATEFYRGISFRWQTGGTVSALSGTSSVEGKTGNQYIYFDKNSEIGLKALKQIKLGDIMASSSCFPVGFEPIIYPRDFTYPGKGNGTGLNSNTLEQAMIITDYNNRPRSLDCSIGLMDGGIDDNQGVYSAMLADKRRRTMPYNNPNPDNGFDLVIVTDVASYFMDPYEPPAPLENGGVRKKNVADLLKGWANDLKKLNGLLKITGIVSVLLLITAILLLVFAEPGGLTNLGYLLLSPAILLLLLVAFVAGYKAGSPLLEKLSGAFNASDKETISTLKEGIPSLVGFSDTALGSMIKYLKGAKIGVLEQMGKARVGSMLSLLLDINLKQTRRLIFDIFFGSFYGKEIWANRRVFNVVYELSLFNIASRESTIRNKFEQKDLALTVPVPGDSWARNCENLLLEGCTKLSSVAEQARTMGTTMWYDKEDSDSKRMDKVVACGQFTTCAKMLEYALVLERILEQEASFPPEKKTLQFGDFDLDLFRKMRRQLEDDWKAFKTDPFMLL